MTTCYQLIDLLTVISEWPHEMIFVFKSICRNIIITLMASLLKWLIDWQPHCNLLARPLSPKFGSSLFMHVQLTTTTGAARLKAASQRYCGMPRPIVLTLMLLEEIHNNLSCHLLWEKHEINQFHNKSNTWSIFTWLEYNDMQATAYFGHS